MNAAMLSDEEKLRALIVVTEALREFIEEGSENIYGQEVEDGEEPITTFRQFVFQYAGKRHSEAAIDQTIAAVALLFPNVPLRIPNASQAV